MTSRCLSCHHLAFFQDAVEGRGITYIGACKHPSRAAVGHTSFCAATENFAYSCREFESAADVAVARALQPEGVE